MWQCNTSSERSELPLTGTKWMWMFLTINLPILALAVLYAVSWSEGWDCFSDKLPTFQLQAQEDTSCRRRAGLAVAWQSCAIALGDGSAGAAWAQVWLWHCTLASLGAGTPPCSPHENCIVCPARFEQESTQPWVELQRRLQREALGWGNPCERDKYCSAVSMQGRGHLKIRRSRRN